MKKILTIICLIWFGLFIFAFSNYKFSSDDVWKIEQQRREHVYMLPDVAKFIHQKGIHFAFKVLENYFSYYSLPIICGIFILQKRRSKLSSLVLYWILIYPLFLSVLLLPLTFWLLLPIIVPLLFSLLFLHKLNNPPHQS